MDLWCTTIHHTPGKQTLEYVLQKQEAGSGWRKFYRLNNHPRVLSPLPEQITIGRIDEAIVGDMRLLNRDLLLEEIHSESPSLEHFFRQHFGFCAQDGLQLVAWGVWPISLPGPL